MPKVTPCQLLKAYITKKPIGRVFSSREHTEAAFKLGVVKEPVQLPERGEIINTIEGQPVRNFLKFAQTLGKLVSRK